MAACEVTCSPAETTIKRMLVRDIPGSHAFWYCRLRTLFAQPPAEALRHLPRRDAGARQRTVLARTGLDVDEGQLLPACGEGGRTHVEGRSPDDPRVAAHRSDRRQVRRARHRRLAAGRFVPLVVQQQVDEVGGAALADGGQ